MVRRRRYKDAMMQATYDELRRLKLADTPGNRAIGGKVNTYLMARYGPAKSVFNRPKGKGPTTFVDVAWAAGIDDRLEAGASK